MDALSCCRRRFCPTRSPGRRWRPLLLPLTRTAHPRVSRFQRTDVSIQHSQVATHDDDDHASSSPIAPRGNISTSSPHQQGIPSSPPPSFHSRSSSLSRRQNQRLLDADPLTTDAERTLADTFDSDSEDDDAQGDDRQRLMRGHPDGVDDGAVSPSSPVGTTQEPTRPQPQIERRVTQLPVFAPRTAGGVATGGRSAMANDGVFANLSAKPTRGEDLEEKPPVSEDPGCSFHGFARFIASI